MKPSTRGDSVRKLNWYTVDFDEMGWHDCKIFAIAFGLKENEISLDIDYILDWIPDSDGAPSFKFLVVPANIVFKNVYDVSFECGSTELIIDEITREDPSSVKNPKYIKEELEYLWTICTLSGNISFRSVGFHQSARSEARLGENQFTSIEERGGISF
jgi:hypothetical protein